MGNIEVVNVTKLIRGATVLNEINLKVDSGGIYGLVGRNGSGKTMLLRLLAGLIRPTSGKLYHDGADVTASERIEAKIGIIIENAPLYAELTGLKNLMYLAGINKFIDVEGVRAALEKVGLDPDDRRTVRKYSLGMKQRLAIAQAIMEEPDYLFLDEPTNALDKEGIRLIHDIIRSQAKRGAIVLIASHHAAEINMLCDTLYDMAEGKLSTRKGRNIHEFDTE